MTFEYNLNSVKVHNCGGTSSFWNVNEYNVEIFCIFKADLIL